jgi:hypothetical protein
MGSLRVISVLKTTITLTLGHTFSRTFRKKFRNFLCESPPEATYKREIIIDRGFFSVKMSVPPCLVIALFTIVIFIDFWTTYKTNLL